MDAKDDAVITTNLTKRFGERTVVRAVNLHIPAGSAYGYLGPNGAGKTTLIRMLLGLTPASSGSMRILGLPVPEQRAKALARVGAIVEEPRFHDHLSARENLEIIAAARGATAATRIDHCLQQMGLRQRADDRVKTYSLGMRQRLGIARCLLADPDILILDEPMNGLDPAGIAEFRTFVHDFIGQGRTVVLSSHLLDEIEKTCTYAAIVDQGRVVAQGTIDHLRNGGEPGLRIRRRPD
jgi:ABC-2 type transport system ATP-binding protein